MERHMAVFPCKALPSYKLVRSVLPMYPSGYWFVPTDVELCRDYLRPKALLEHPIMDEFIPEIDFLIVHILHPIQFKDVTFEGGYGEYYFYTKYQEQEVRGVFGHWNPTGEIESLTDEGAIIGTKSSFVYCSIDEIKNTINDDIWAIYLYRLLGQENPQNQRVIVKLINHQRRQQYQQEREAQDRSIEFNMCCSSRGKDSKFRLAPVGFKFLPTDVELLRHYLPPKVEGYPIAPAIDAIPEVDEIMLQNYNPMQLRDRAYDAKDGSFYFFTKTHQGLESLLQRRDGNGYWQATGVTESLTDKEGTLIGTKRAFIYHFNLNDNDNSWTMYEYHLPERSSMGQNPQQRWLLAKLRKDQRKKEYERQED